MKRRDFLIASTSILAPAYTGLARSQTRPCPPPGVAVTGGTSASTNCGPSTAPNWFVQQAEKTWVAVAGGSGFGQAWQNGQRQQDVRPSGDYGNFANLGYAWTGGAAIQATGEFGQVVDGGHNTWHGNDIYMIGLRQEVPSWQRIYGPSPIAQIKFSDPSTDNAPFDANFDGTPRTSHGWFNRIASNSRLWVFRTADGPAANQTTNCWSIDRTNLAAGWMYHGRAFANPGATSYFYASGPSVHDPETDKVYWAMEATTGANDTVIIDVASAVAAGNQSATGPQIPGSTLVGKANPTSPSPLANSWSALAIIGPYKAWICGSPNYSRIYVLNLNNPAAGWTTQTPGGSAPPGYGAGMGAAYHAPSQAVLIAGIRNGGSSTAAVYKLAVPSNPFGSGYAWQSVTNSGGGVTPSVPSSEVDQFRGTFGKLRMINDMGDGRAALVMHTSTIGPVFVYKLPLGSLA